jgi:FlaA1/EpsC-like NDP-sugar epimerase
VKEKTILVTGGTGFLGQRLVRSIVKNGGTAIATGYSEARIKKFERGPNGGVPLYSVDIASDYTMLKNIIKKHSVDYIIHTAALKHVGICQDNPARAVDVNVIGSRNIARAAMEGNVKNVIGISTDKSIEPLCLYGMTKRLMEEMFIEYGFGIFQGVNFLFSSESVLDVWDKLRSQNEPILVNMQANRYFSTIKEVQDRVLSSIKEKGKFSVEHCYKISIYSLYRAYATYHDYWNMKEYIPREFEKTEEELPLQNIKIIEPDDQHVTQLMKQFYESLKTA